MDLTYKHEKTLFLISAIISALVWLIITVGTFGVIFVYILIGYLFFLFAHSAFISQLKGNGVHITEEQFPELYQSIQKNAEKVGLKDTPDAYLLRTGFFNALATRFRGRNFIVLFTDVVDALEQQPSAIDFYIGHELGHLHRKHIQWSSFLFPAAIFPLLGAAYRRSQEYTCDRYGAYCSNSDADVVTAMSAMAAGDSRWSTLNLNAYLNQIKDTNGFWMSFNELTNDYPWLTKRMAAALAYRKQENVSFPSRNWFAWLLSLFVPRLGLGSAGGGGFGLMIVVAIIGILAAIALPAYQQYTQRASISSAYVYAKPLQEEITAFTRANGGQLPNSLAELGLNANDLSNTLVHEGGVITVEVLLNDTDEQFLIFAPEFDGNDIRWICSGSNLEPKLLPAQCR